MRVLSTRQKLLLTIVAVAVVARLGSAVYQGNRVEAMPGVADQVSYHKLAVRVLEGHGFTFDTGWWPATPAGQPTAHWSYLYVLFLTGVYSIFGVHALPARIVQAIVAGVLQPLLTQRIAARLFGERAGLAAAALAAVYGYFVFYSGALMTEQLFIISVLWVIDAAMLLPERPLCLWKWTQLGLAMGGAALFRQMSLVLVPFVLAWVLYRAVAAGARPGTALTRGALTAAVLAACIAPCTIRNDRAFGQFVLLNTNAGFAFFWGNHPIHGTHFMPLLAAGDPGYGDLIPRELRGLNEAAMDRALLGRGVGFVLGDPARYLQLSVSRLREYVKFWPESTSGTVSNYARVLSFGLCLPLFFGGVMIASFRRNRKAPGALLILGVAALYSAVYLMSWTLVRYRLPVDALLMPFGGLALDCIVARAERHRPASMPAAA